ncbi:hypothetical protein VNO78_32805 [Psophocarpus tetragonolobus]|uniref:Uncharacterized protein n=1 Tax=Psophocarpus tetragonolobus TaxID=3891 RepID=A0AAN9RQA2_PSOTE
MVKKMKKGESSRSSNSEDEINKSNELPLSLLPHLMGFMNTKNAVETCVLSKDWKDLWKYVTTLSLDSSQFIRLDKYFHFVSSFLSNRDHSIPLLNLDIMVRDLSEFQLLNWIMQYVLFHNSNVQHLRMDIIMHSLSVCISFHPLISSFSSLKYLRLSISPSGPDLKLPNTLPLPALKTFHLENICFTASDNDTAEPFSSCGMLNTLTLDSCYLDNGAKVLSISSSTLSTLNLDYSFKQNRYKIVLSTPNLSSFTAAHFGCHQLSSVCHLPFLQRVNIDAGWAHLTPSPIINWLIELYNMKRMIISSRTLQSFLQDPDSEGAQTQPPYFVRLESVMVVMNSWIDISNVEVKKMLKYLLQNSPPNKVIVIKR